MVSMGWKATFAAAAAGAVVLAGGTLKAQTEVDLKQGWTGPQIDAWYGLNQGSRLIPLSWLRALEQPGAGGGKFLDPGYIASFRYLARPGGGLPVGFAIDPRDDSKFGLTRLPRRPGQTTAEPWVGLTCSACHTTELRSGANVMRVQGAPTLGDFQSLLEQLDLALKETAAAAPNPKFDRFAAQVLAGGGSKEDLRKQVQRLSQHEAELAGMNHTTVRYGYGRLDAVGYILNKVSWAANGNGGSSNPPDAPVSYPFLWNVPQHTNVQWNGIATNTPGGPVDVGALGRNVGEVIGVFADVQVTKSFLQQPKYVTSVNVDSLIAAERQLGSLKPPTWPRTLFPINTARAKQGRDLFGDNCLMCHGELRSDDLVTRERHPPYPGDPRTGPLALEELSYFAPQDPAKETKTDTDIWMGCNSALDQASTGKLNGTLVLGGKPLETFKPKASNSKMLVTMVLGVMFENAAKIAGQIVAGFTATEPPAALPPSPSFAAVAPGLGSDRSARRAACDVHKAGATTYRDLKYKGRPLDGVWATGPFLHNGSAPTLWDLLQPPADRPKMFFTGSREFDPVKVGFVTDQSAENNFPLVVRKPDGARVDDGNSNEGHDYGTKLTADERLAILEYLKVIGEPL